jgi:hypothetical protein
VYHFFFPLWLVKFDFHYPTPYDGTLQTFALLKI